MTDKIKEELDEMEETSFADEVKAHKDGAENEGDVEGEAEQVAETTEETPEEKAPDASEDVPEAAKEEDLEEKRKAYKERQEKRKRDEDERRREQEQLRAQADTAQQQDRTQYLEQVAARMERRDMMQAAKRELSALEKDFVEAYPDYHDKVKTAIDFTKMNLMKKGFSETEALEQIENEKIMLADAAVRAGKDPVEAVYKEASDIESIIDEFAEQRGYVKPDKKTNLQKKRELSKPNAMQGGRGTRAVQKGLMDDDNDELDNMSLGDMLKAKKAGML